MKRRFVDMTRAQYCWLVRGAVAALIAAVLTAAAASVNQVYAGDPSCIDYACSSNQACKSIQGLECVACLADRRCSDKTLE